MYLFRDRLKKRQLLLSWLPLNFLTEIRLKISQRRTKGRRDLTWFIIKIRATIRSFDCEKNLAMWDMHGPHRWYADSVPDKRSDWLITYRRPTSTPRLVFLSFWDNGTINRFFSFFLFCNNFTLDSGDVAVSTPFLVSSFVLLFRHFFYEMFSVLLFVQNFC